MKQPIASFLRLIAIAAIAVTPLLAVSQASADTAPLMSITPASQTVNKGGDVTFKLNVNHGDGEIRVWQAYITYPTSIFSGGEVAAATDSPFTWPGDTTVNNGVISISYTTTLGASAYIYDGPLATITLHTANAGTAALSFGDKCVNNSQQVCNAAVTVIYDADSPQGRTANLIGTNNSGATVTVSDSSGSDGTTTGGSQQTGGTSSNPGTTTGTDSGVNTNAKVTVTVVSQTGKPVAGAKVTIARQSATTNNHGQATVANVPPGVTTGTVTYKDQTHSIDVDVKDGASKPHQTTKATIKVKESSAITPIAITVGTLLVVSIAVYALIGPRGGVSSLIRKLPGQGGKGGPGPKPPTPSKTGPTPPKPPTPPAHNTPVPHNAAKTPESVAPKNPKTILAKHVDPIAPGTTFTPKKPINL